MRRTVMTSGSAARIWFKAKEDKMTRTREENAADLAWEEAYKDAAKRDFERMMYERADAEADAEEALNALVLASHDASNDPPLQGVCKDCGNGTLNNALFPAFTLDEDGWRCNKCYGEHLDVL